MTRRTDGPYQRRMYAVWDGDRSPWPASHDGNPLPAKRIAEQRSIKGPEKFDVTHMQQAPYFTFERKRIIYQLEQLDAIICDGIIVEPKHLRGIELKS